MLSTVPCVSYTIVWFCTVFHTLLTFVVLYFGAIFRRYFCRLRSSTLFFVLYIHFLAVLSYLDIAAFDHRRALYSQRSMIGDGHHDEHEHEH